MVLCWNHSCGRNSLPLQKMRQEIISDRCTGNYWIQINSGELFNPYLNITENYERQVREYNWDIKEIQRLKNTHHVFYFAGWHGITFLCTKGETEPHEGYNYMLKTKLKP